MSTATKVVIQVESVKEQQENIKNQRKTLKVLQGVSSDKENLTGRPKLDELSRLKAAVSETISLSTNSDYSKRKKIESKPAETQTSPDVKSNNNKKITEEDLCSEAKPSEGYYERLAENRRETLGQALEENQLLYARIDGLEEELNTSRQQLEEAQHLVSVLTEILNESEAEEENREIEAEESLASIDVPAEEVSVDNPEDLDDSNSTPKVKH